MNSKKILLLRNAAYFFVSILSVAAPIKIFTHLFLKKIHYLPFINNEFLGIVFISIFYSLICMVLAAIFFDSTFGAFIFLLIYPVLFTFLAYSTAYDYRVEFGNTWTRMEVLIGLVFTHWYYYLLLFAGIAVNFSLNLWYLMTKK